MIPYDELCQALERWAALRRNEAELEALDADVVGVATDDAAIAAAEAASLSRGADGPGYDAADTAYEQIDADHAEVVDADMLLADGVDGDVDGEIDAEAQADDARYDETPRSVEVDIADGDALTHQPTELVPDADAADAAAGDDGLGDVPTILAGDEAHGDPSAQSYDMRADEHLKREGEA